MGQTCYQSVILQALLHDPTLNAYFLAGGHDVHTCKRNFCMACAAAEVFMDFNSGEKTDAVSAATLLYHGWDASKVSWKQMRWIPLTNSLIPHRKWPVTANRTPTNTSSSW